MRSLLLLIENIILETPRIAVNNTLAVATRPPIDTIWVAMELPETAIAVESGLGDPEIPFAPTSPMATTPTRM